MPAAKKQPVDDLSEPDATKFVGRRVVCPGEIFNSPGQVFRGKVTGTPKTKSKSRSRCYVRFEGDDTTEYWFPAKDVAGWLVDSSKGGQAFSESSDQRQGFSDTSDEHARRALSDSRFATTTDQKETSTEAYPTEEEDNASLVAEGEGEDDIPKATAGTVRRGAEYGIPLGITLLVLVLAALGFRKSSSPQQFASIYSLKRVQATGQQRAILDLNNAAQKISKHCTRHHWPESLII